MPKQNAGEPHDWVTRAADDAVRHAQQTADGERVITCASGASPSGPIHLGNLREFITPHFVAEEIRRRGLPVRHLHSWDDFDRFRKVPAGVDASWADHIGRPLSDVPDPWECHPSWAEHYKAPLREALAELGIEMEEVSQTERYRAGAYTDLVLHAIRHRDVIEQVLGRFRTRKSDAEGDPEPTEEDDDETSGTGDLARFPYKPYCRQCGRDTVELTSYDDETTDLGYTCSSCGFTGVTNVATQHEGKLVWKVDWPMRWSVEGVDFEPGGLDHSTPGSSYTVGKELVKQVFDFRAPSYVAYAFVGFAGVQKMSSSAGGVPTATDALRILEAPMVRWLYVRRAPKQAFTIDFGDEVIRLYDEWDALGRKATDPEKRDAAVLAYERAVSTSTGPLPSPVKVESFRQLSSVADIMDGNVEAVCRAAGATAEELEPRLGRAVAWAKDNGTTHVRSEPDAARLAALTEDEHLWLAQLLDRLPDDLELEPTTALVYGVPKLVRGLGLGDPPTEEVKADQKAFFQLLYNLLVDADRGPRLPTLFRALGSEKVRSLLGG